jgi:hypothetical protein
LFKSMVGEVFNRWTVVSRAENSRAGQIRYLCRCDCGNEAIVQSAALKDNHSKSCGCLKVETTRRRSTTHGHSRHGNTSPTYHSWSGMLARCSNEGHHHFKYYGGRGIRVCERWKTFANFLEDMGEKPIGLSIERDDGNGNYELGNCRWATLKEQARNKRSNRFVTANGSSLTIAEWSEKTGIHPATISDRLQRGWPEDRAVLTAPRNQ